MKYAIYALRNSKLKIKMGPFYSNSLENYLERTPYGFTFNQIMKSAMEFDFNKDKMEGETSFEEKLRGDITNELGNIMVSSAVEVIVIQFRKFMALTAYELLNRKDKNITPRYDVQYYFEQEGIGYKSNDDIYFESCFHPPIIVDLVWKTLITNAKIYKEYCYELCGGFIDRVDPSIMDNIGELYNNFLIKFSYVFSKRKLKIYRIYNLSFNYL